MATVYYDTAAAGAGTGADWANAFTTLAAAITGAGSGGTIYVASSSNETTANATTTLSWSGTVSAPTKIYSVNKAGSVPPVAADLLAGAIFANNNAVTSTNLTMTGSMYANGVEFRAGVGQTITGNITFGSGGGQSFVLENCKLWLATTFNTATIATANNHITVILRNTVLKFAATGQKINVNSGRLYWHDTPSALDTGGTIPTQLFSASATGLHNLERLDLSAYTTTLFGTASVTAAGVWAQDCKLGSGGGAGQFNSIDGGFGRLVRSGNATNMDNFVQCLDGACFIGHSLVTARSGGGSYDGSTPFSWALAPTGNNNVYHRPKSADVEVYNTLTGGSHTVTMYGIANMAAMPTNAQIWLESSYLSDSSSPLKTMVSSGLATILSTASNNTADTSDWTAGTAGARANTTLYNVGDRIKLASNTGRLFFCTTGGTSSGSEPVGYASAVDGGSVTDGGAVFRAGWRFKMTVTLGTINRAGLIVSWARIGDTTNSYWIDPDVTVA